MKYNEKFLQLIIEEITKHPEDASEILLAWCSVVFPVVSSCSLNRKEFDTVAKLVMEFFNRQVEFERQSKKFKATVH